MKILFSPSETKFKGGKNIPLTAKSFIFPELFDSRMKAIQAYQNYIDTANQTQLAQLFGTAKLDVIEYYKGELLNKEIRKVIERYDGVAFDYLQYNMLSVPQKEYIDNNVMIFSNLFGPILAGDMGLPDYKLKQNEKIGEFALEKFYNEMFSNSLDDYLKDEEIIDLRAGFYEKFYKIKQPYLTMKFLNNGKVVSHWAKAYRGIVLKMLAINNIQSIEALMNMEIENLKVEEIKTQKNKTEITYAILD